MSGLWMIGMTSLWSRDINNEMGSMAWSSIFCPFFHWWSKSNSHIAVLGTVALWIAVLACVPICCICGGVDLIVDCRKLALGKRK